MTLKLVIGLSLGAGGVGMLSYSIVNHMRKEVITITPHTSGVEGLGTSVCNTPIKKATISNDENVIYYICNTITSVTVGTEKATATVTTSTKSTFTPTTSTTDGTNPAKWTYKQENKSTGVDIYWYKKTDDQQQETFIMKSSTPSDSTVDLTTIEGIKSVIKDIEELRSKQRD